jgi:hypothetical protein
MHKHDYTEIRYRSPRTVIIVLNRRGAWKRTAAAKWS